MPHRNAAVLDRSEPWIQNAIERVLLSEEQIRTRIAELGQQISKDYAGQHVILVSILKGSVIFLADLVRSLSIPVGVDFMAVSSYVGSETSGIVRVTMDLRESAEGKHVILVEDIVDTGLTLAYLKNLLKARHVKSLKICALLDKKESHRVEVPVDYLGFKIPSEFVVGYGLDYSEQFRNLPFVGILKKEYYSKPDKK